VEYFRECRGREKARQAHTIANCARNGESPSFMAIILFSPLVEFSHSCSSAGFSPCSGLSRQLSCPSQRVWQASPYRMPPFQYFGRAYTSRSSAEREWGGGKGAARGQTQGELDVAAGAGAVVVVASVVEFEVARGIVDEGAA